MDEALDREIKKLEDEICRYVHGVLVKDKDSIFRHELQEGVRKAIGAEIGTSIADLRNDIKNLRGEIASLKSKLKQPVESTERRGDGVAAELSRLAKAVDAISRQLALTDVSSRGTTQPQTRPADPEPEQRIRYREEPPPPKESYDNSVPYDASEDEEEPKPSGFKKWLGEHGYYVKYGGIVLLLLLLGMAAAFGYRRYQSYTAETTNSAIHSYDPAADDRGQQSRNNPPASQTGDDGDPNPNPSAADARHGFDRLTTLTITLDGKPAKFEQLITKLCNDKHITPCRAPHYPGAGDTVYASAVIQYAALAIAEKTKCPIAINKIDGQVGAATAKELRVLQDCLIDRASHHEPPCYDNTVCVGYSDLSGALERRDYSSVLDWLLPMVSVLLQ